MTPTKTKVKAFAYLRVSSTSQTTGDGFARQLDAITQYAHANIIEIVKVYKEDYAGTEIDRPVLAEMLVSMEKNHHGVKTVVIERMDRLGRELMTQEYIIRDFQSKGFNLISALEGADLLMDDPSRTMIRQILGSVAQHDKSMLVLKLRAARERKKLKTGKAEGRKAYFETEEGKAIINKINAYRRTKHYGRQKSWAVIADILNAEGIPTMTGKKWTATTVRNASHSLAKSKKYRKKRK